MELLVTENVLKIGPPGGPKIGPRFALSVRVLRWGTHGGPKRVPHCVPKMGPRFVPYDLLFRDALVLVSSSGSSPGTRMAARHAAHRTFHL